MRSEPDRLPPQMRTQEAGDGRSDGVASAARFEASAAKSLFETSATGPFDVSSDGCFLMAVPVEQSAATVPITVVVNWRAALKR